MDLEANEAENNKVEMKIEENKTQPERETWGGKLDFFLSALGFTGTIFLKIPLISIVQLSLIFNLYFKSDLVNSNKKVFILECL